MTQQEKDAELYKRKAGIVQKFYQMVAAHGDVDYDGIVKIVEVIGQDIRDIDKPIVKRGRKNATVR